MNKADKETLSAIIQTQIGVSKKLKGYQYLEDAVEIALQNPQDASDANLSAARQPARQKCSQH